MGPPRPAPRGTAAGRRRGPRRRRPLGMALAELDPGGQQPHQPLALGVGGVQVQGLAAPADGGALGVGGQEHLQQLGHPVSGQRRRDRPGVAVGALGVDPVHGRLLGHAPVPEPDRLLGAVEGPHGSLGVGGLQHGQQLVQALGVPAEQLGPSRGRRRPGIRRRGQAPADDLQLVPVHHAGVQDQVGDGPPRAGRHRRVEPLAGGRRERRAVVAERLEVVGRVHPGSLPDARQRRGVGLRPTIDRLRPARPARSASRPRPGCRRGRPG